MSKLIPEQLINEIPPLYSTEELKEPTVYCKLFLGNWTWFITEIDFNRDICFGYVQSPFCDGELGYFTLSEIEEIRGPLGLEAERDLSFKPTLLSNIRNDS